MFTGRMHRPSASRVKTRLFTALLLGAAAPAWAGPPYLTDDPAPTDLKQWEIYSFLADEGIDATQDADAGLDLNYGAAKGVQLTATLPLSFSRESPQGWRSGAGDVEVAVKYRFLDDEKHGVSAAIFPRVILPTSSLEADGKTRVLLPLWLQKDFAGGTSLFGGRGSAYSALLGILVIQSISNGMFLLNKDSSVRFMITGAVLLTAVLIDTWSRRRGKGRFAS